MHVHMSSRSRYSRPPLAAAVIALFAGLAGVASAVEFDEKVKAPQVLDAAGLRARSQSYAERDALARASGIGAVVRDRALSQERFDVTWQLQRAIDEKRPLAEMADLGFVDRGDGSFSVDINAHPQWMDPADNLSQLLPALNPTMLGADLARRGMKAEELAKLREYLATHDAKAATAKVAAPIAIGFSRIVKKYDKLKRPVPDALVMSFIYQRDRATTEVRRQWADSLLETIGPSAGRIIESYVGEMRSSSVWGPSDNRQGIDGQLALMRLPDYEQKVLAEVQGVTP